MPAPSKNYTLIADTSVDADSPLDVTLLTAIRDNGIHLEEWLGDGYTAMKDHNHDGVNSASATVGNGALSAAKFGSNAGDTVVASADTLTGNLYGGWTKRKEIKVARSGAFRVKFNGYGGTNVQARIYRNGAALGTLRQLTGTDTVYSEDFSGWTAGDLCQLWGNTISGYHSLHSFRVCDDNQYNFVTNLD